MCLKSSEKRLLFSVCFLKSKIKPAFLKAITKTKDFTLSLAKYSPKVSHYTVYFLDLPGTSNSLPFPKVGTFETTPSPLTAPPTTTTSLATTAPPTTTKPTGKSLRNPIVYVHPSIDYNIPSAPFETTPSPLTVAVEQEVATFYCQHLSSFGITWLVNGTSLNRINSTNISTFSSDTLHSLSIGTLLEYNGTTVQCVATFLDGSSPIFAPTVTLLIQGTYI